MAEVKTAPVSKPASKAAAKAAKPKAVVQAKAGPQGSIDKLIQPFLITNRPAIPNTSAQNGNSLAKGLWKNSVQTKLKIGQPGDKYEQEADAVAYKVVSSPAPEISKQPNEEQLDRKPIVQLSPQPEEEVQASPTEENEVQASLEEEPEVQTQPEEEPEIQASLQEEPEVQASLDEDSEVHASPAEEQEIQTQNGDGTAPASFESQLDSSKSGGSPLPQSTISQVEPHVNADLSGVRVHTDSSAVQMNQSLGAQAFANENHIFFNEGKYNPGTTAGDHLIAHEATHTVQQGASVKKKPVEEEAPEEIQTKADEPASEVQQTAAPPVDSGTPVDSAPNANNNPPGDNGADAPPPADGGAPADAGGNIAPSGPDGAQPPAEPKEDVQKENPITQRAAAYKEEKVSEVKALGMEGNSEQAMASFTGAGASQVAMALPGMGEALNQKLGSEKQAVAKDAPKLTAGTTGVKDQKSKNATDPGNGKAAILKDSVTEAEPAPAKVDPYQEGAPLPAYKVDDKVDQGKPAKEESSGFFSWLFDKFKNLMGGINTDDNGLNTKAGAAPKIDTKGKANPERAANQSKEGKDQVNKEKEEAANEINKNPGQQNVQPLFFEEPKEVIIDAQLQSKATTTEDQAMTDFVSLPLPESVRTQTDLDLAPKMEKTLAKPRQETKMAAQKRDTDKQAAINEKQTEVEKMNKDAETQQQNLVNENRQVIAAEQKKGVQEAETQMNAFSTEADKEKVKANKEVNSRIKKDQADGEKKLKKAEGEAEVKKKEGEKQAKAEKEAAKKNSKDKSWWGKFKDAVSSAVSWVTEKIGKIFDGIRKAVKFLIDTAKKAALALIEAGRKWIIDKLDKFGNWLKEKANKYLKHFPALRKRVNAFIDKTVDSAKKLVNKVADGLKKGVEALANALGKAINSVLSAFEGVLTAAVQFAGAMLKGDFAEALKIAFMATCKVAGIDPTPILNFINKAGETIGMIFKNPAAFFGHVAGGVKLGISQFVKNIKKHLISGLIGWLTGAMSDVPIQMPAKFDLKGIFSLVMQILGLTYDRIRAKVVKRIGPKGEQVVSGMENTFQFVKDLITKGPIALWERIKDKFAEIKEMAMEKIRNLVTIEVVKAGIKWLIGLLNPASAIVKAVLMLYDFVMFLVERKDQIMGFVTAIFDTVGPLARGQIKKVGNAVEGAMGKGVPVILGLLANLAGLGGIGKSVSKVIKTIQKPVDKVVDPIIGWLVKQGKKLYGKGKAGVKNLKDKVFNWWKTEEKLTTKRGDKHEVKIKKIGSKYKTSISSNKETDLDTFLDQITRYVNGQGKIPFSLEDDKIPASIPKEQRDTKLISYLQELRVRKIAINTLLDHFSKYKNGLPVEKKAEFDKLKADLRDIKSSVNKALNAIPSSEEGTDTIPKTGIIHQSGAKKGFNSTMRVNLLTVKGQPGSPPGTMTGDAGDAWNALRTRRKGSGSYYVLGHLLSEKLHGKGVAANLIPITRPLNDAHETQESKVKIATNKGASTYYSVTASDFIAAPDFAKSAVQNKPDFSDERLEAVNKVRKAENGLIPKKFMVEGHNVDPSKGDDNAHPRFTPADSNLVMAGLGNTPNRAPKLTWEDYQIDTDDKNQFQSLLSEANTPSPGRTYNNWGDFDSANQVLRAWKKDQITDAELQTLKKSFVEGFSKRQWQLLRWGVNNNVFEIVSPKDDSDSTKYTKTELHQTTGINLSAFSRNNNGNPMIATLGKLFYDEVLLVQEGEGQKYRFTQAGMAIGRLMESKTAFQPPR